MMYNVIHMRKDERIIFRLGTDLREALLDYSQHYGRSESDVTREALVRFLEPQGFFKPVRKRGGKRKK